jgi:carboxymethylenebutenolidase
MGEMLKLKAADGFALDAYRATPRGAPRGAVVIAQEIFGVNSHIKAVCDGYAADGYLAIAPALFDRVEPGFDVGYAPEDIERGRALRGKLGWKEAMADTAAAVQAARSAGPVAVIGYCYGGGVAWLAGTRIPGLAATIGYYGGPWGEFKAEAPKCPSLLHFGAKDAMIPVALAEEMRNLHPAIIAHVYEADHGFNCDQRKSYDAFAATLARARSIAFLTAVM